MESLCVYILVIMIYAYTMVVRSNMRDLLVILKYPCQNQCQYPFHYQSKQHLP